MTKISTKLDCRLPPPIPERNRLPDERKSLTHKFTIFSPEYGEIKGYLIVGLYDDGSPGELFIHIAKEGSLIQGLCDAICLSVSIALQSGVPMDKFVDKFMHLRFESEGFTRNPSIPMAKSIVDYIFTWLGQKFCGLPAHPFSIEQDLDMSGQ